MSVEAFRTEINRHLDGKNNIVSHFSSWTADFQTAVRYSWGGRDQLVRHHRHIGIFDTSRRDHSNTILHVRALREQGHTRFEYDYEYLVYGPVKGISYTCLALPRGQNPPLSPPLRPPLYSGWSGWPAFRRYNALSHIRMAYNQAAHYSFYHGASTAHEACWGSCTDTALYLTIIAAEWSREARFVYQRDLFFEDPWASESFRKLLVLDLSQVIEWAARDATLVLPLVNPRTHQADLPRLALMIKLLSLFEDEIIKIRSRPPSPEPWSLTRFLWGWT